MADGVSEIPKETTEPSCDGKPDELSSDSQPSGELSPGNKLCAAMFAAIPNRDLCKYFGNLYDALCLMCRGSSHADLSFLDYIGPTYLVFLFELVKPINLELIDVDADDIEECCEYSLGRYMKEESQKQAMFRLSCKLLTNVICSGPLTGTYSVREEYQSMVCSRSYQMCLENGGGEPGMILLRYIVSKLIYREGRTALSC